MKSLTLVFQFFTRLPTPQHELVNEEDMGQALSWLPFVGLVIGLMLWIVSLLNGMVSAEVTAVLILAFWVWVTGTLHIDGAADFADAWLGAPHDHQRALEIMKDSRIGTGGGVAIGLILLAKWVLLVELLDADLAVWLLMVPVLARVGSLVLMVTTPFASQNGMAETMFQYLNHNSVWAWLGAAALLVLFSAPILLLLIFVWFSLRAQMQKTLGGMNGDSAGLQTEVMEIVALLLLVLTI